MIETMGVFATVGIGVAALFAVYKLPFKWATVLTFLLFGLILAAWVFLAGVRHGAELAVEQAVASGVRPPEGQSLALWAQLVEFDAEDWASSASNKLLFIQFLCIFAPAILIARRAKGEGLIITDKTADASKLGGAADKSQ